jgi:cytoskeletal protein RodZ
VPERKTGAEARGARLRGEYDGTMRRSRPNVLVLAAAFSAALALAACGSSTKTVTVSNAPPVSQTTATTAPSTQTQTTSTQTSPSQSQTTSTPTETGTTTHTAPEPAFTQQESKAEGISGAAADVRARGYTPNDTSEYHSNQTLRVLVGTQTGSSDGYGQQAFFFVDGRYLGTDTKLPSATVKVVSQADTEVTLAYPIYRHGDPLSSPSGGEAHVTFALNNGKLVPSSAIPPASSRN